MKTTRVLVQVLLLITLVVVLLTAQSEVGNFIVGLRDIAYGIFGPSCDVQNMKRIEVENKSLRKQVEFLSLKNRIRDEKGELLANVYSSYPFSDKVHIIVDKGSIDGVNTGMPVMIDKNIVVGKVISVRKTQSEVQTIFDPEWKTSVIVGTSTKAVLKGGNTPEIQFIPKEATIAPLDTVLNIAQEFPMHALLGSIKSIREDEKKLWQIATLEIPISFDAINSVTILTKFP
jgi:cell shape-determining protein MreC